MDVFLMPDAKGKLLALLQVQQFVQTYETLRSGEQTQTFVRSKKVDAVCRSCPSIVLQLYGLMISLGSIDQSGVNTIALSVAAGIFGSAMTLGQLAPKSGNELLSFDCLVHIYYYVCELSARMICVAMLFTSLGPLAFIPLGFDFVFRLFLGGALTANCDCCSIAALIEAVLSFGSDAVDGPQMSSVMVYFPMSTSNQLIALACFNALNTPFLREMRGAYGGVPVRALTAVAVICEVSKWFFGVCIGCADASTLNQAEKEEEEAGAVVVVVPSGDDKAAEADAGEIEIKVIGGGGGGGEGEGEGEGKGGYVAVPTAAAAASSPPSAFAVGDKVAYNKYDKPWALEAAEITAANADGTEFELRLDSSSSSSSSSSSGGGTEANVPSSLLQFQSRELSIGQSFDLKVASELDFNCVCSGGGSAEYRQKRVWIGRTTGYQGQTTMVIQQLFYIDDMSVCVYPENSFVRAEELTIVLREMNDCKSCNTCYAIEKSDTLFRYYWLKAPDEETFLKAVAALNTSA